MARILMIANGTLGDVLPMFSLAENLHKCGHHVRLIAPESYRSHVTHAILYLPLAGNEPKKAQEDYVATAPGSHVLKSIRHLVRLNRSPDMPLFDDILRLKDDMRWCELVVGSHMYLPAVHLAFHLCRKWVTFHPAPIIVSRTYAHPVGPLWWHLLPKPRFVNLATHELWEKFIAGATEPWISRFQKEVLGGKSYGTGALESLVRSIPKVIAVSRHLFPVNEGWPRHWHLTGYLRDVAYKAQPLPSDVEAFLAAGEQPVFLGFSSSPVLDGSFWNRVVIPALQRLGKRAIIGAGWSTVPAELSSPSVLVVSYLSFRDLFPRVVCAVHACGVGTLSEAVWNGTPSVCVPVFGEQKMLAALAYKVGVTPRPVLLKQLDAGILYNRLRTAIDRPQYRIKATEIAGCMHAERGLERASSIVESYL